MLSSTPPIRFVYLSPHEEQQVQHLLAEVKRHQAQISPLAGAQLDRTLQLLSAWQISASLVRAVLLQVLLQHGLARPVGVEEEVVTQAVELSTLASFPHADEPEHTRRAVQYHRLRTLFIAAYQRLGLPLTCLAQHTARMESIQTLDPRAARLLAEENEVIFLPLLEMLGMWQLRRDLGDISLKVLNPRRAGDRIQAEKAAFKKEAEQVAQPVIATIERECRRRGLVVQVERNPNAASSIYRRFVRGEPLEKLVRKVKLDIIADTTDACYTVLGVIHQLYQPVVGRSLIGGFLRDLIAMPKFNGYRALVTTFSQPRGDSRGETLVEARIYSQRMLEINLWGVIAVRTRPPDATPVKAWWEDHKTADFVRDHPVATFSNDIYVFSNVGEVYFFPQGSTPVDFAYRVHSEVGNRSKEFVVNGQPAPFDYELRNGDVVQIQVDPNVVSVDERWLGAVKSSVARSNIRRVLRQRQAQPQGQVILNKVFDQELQLYKLSLSDEDRDKLIEYTARTLRYGHIHALYADVEEGRCSPSRLVNRAIASRLAPHIVTASGEPLALSASRIRFAQCYHQGQPCRVRAGTAIVGRRINPGAPHERLTVYRRDCPNAPSEDEAVPLKWLGEKRPGDAVEVRIEAVDRPMLLDRVLETIYAGYPNGLYLLQAKAEVARDRSASIVMKIEADNYQVLEQLRRRLSELKSEGVIGAFDVEPLSPLEKLLLAETRALPNPYNNGTPVRDRRLFMGRELEVQQVVSCLQGDQNAIMVLGNTRVGKTSLLYYVKDHVASHCNMVPVLVDLQQLSTQAELGLWRALAAEVEDTVAGLYTPRKKRAARPAHITGFDAFRGWLLDTLDRLGDRKLLLVLDEFSLIDTAWDRREAGQLIPRLRALVDELGQLSVLFSVQARLYNRVALDNLVSAPLVRLARPVWLDHLARDAAEKLIRDPMGQMLVYEPAVVERILDLTQGHPYYLQYLLHELVDHVRATQRDVDLPEVTGADLDLVVERLLQVGQALFYDFERHSEKIQRDIVRAIASQMASGADVVGLSLIQSRFGRRSVTASVEDLCSLGILERRGAGYAFRVPLYQEWLRRFSPST